MELASGGMGVVWIARKLGAGGFERFVVLKRVHDKYASDRDFRKMLRDEARIMSFVHDAHVASVLDVVDAGGRLSLVLEYVESVSFFALLDEARVRNVRVPIPIVARIMCDALAGLHAAHEARASSGEELGIIHRDVSPDNVIVGLDGTSRIIDFGIAKATMQPITPETTTGVFKGKLRFMSPEQVQRKPLDRRTDVFSAGIVLYVALTGKGTIFRNEDESDLLMSLLLGDVLPPREQVPELPEALEAVVMRALAHDRADRFATTADLADAIERATPVATTREVARYVSEHGGATIAARRERLGVIVAQRRRQRVGRRVWIALGAFAFVAFVAFAVSRGMRTTRVETTSAPALSATPSVAASTVDVEDLPTVTIVSQTSARPAGKPTPAHVRPRPTADCTPPFDVLADGTHRFKPECVRPPRSP